MLTHLELAPPDNTRHYGDNVMDFRTNWAILMGDEAFVPIPYTPGRTGNAAENALAQHPIGMDTTRACTTGMEWQFRDDMT